MPKIPLTTRASKSDIKPVLFKQRASSMVPPVRLGNMNNGTLERIIGEVV